MTDLKISDVSYDQVTDNYIEFLKSQDDYKDLDFESSAVRRIVSLLAYDQHYSAYYAHASFRENFMDSAILRSSVISHAKKYNYVPTSQKASTAIVDVRLENGSTILNSNIILPKGTLFSGTTRDRSGSFTFTTDADYSIYVDSFDATFESIKLVQGSYTSFDYKVDTYNKNQRLEVPDLNVDTEYLEVYVQEGSDDSRLTKYTKANNSLTTADETVYWIQENPNGRYEIYFGDDIIGKSVGHGKIVRFIYLKTNADEANNIEEFTYSTSNANFNSYLTSTFSSIQVSSLSTSQGGTQRETVEQIKFHAPRYRGNGENALRPQDFEERILEDFPEIKNVNVFDASFLDDPSGKVGKIFLSAIPRNTTFFTKARKNEILNDIQNNMTTVNKCFEFIDPSYIYPKVFVTVNLSKNTKSSIEFIERKLKDAALQYSEENLEDFGSVIERSDFTTLLASVDGSIDNVLLDIRMEARFNPIIGETSGYVKTLDNELLTESVLSNNFEIDYEFGYVKDDGNGELSFYSATTNELLTSCIGKVNYQNGYIELYPINVTSGGTSFNDIKISGKAKNLNITSFDNNVMVIEEECVSVQINNYIANQRVKY